MALAVVCTHVGHSPLDRYRLVVGIWRAALAEQKSLFRVGVWQVWRRTADNNSGLRQRWWIVVTKNGNGAVPRIPVGIMASLSADMKQPVAMSLDKVIDAIAEIAARHSTSRAAVLTSARFVARDLDRSLRLFHKPSPSKKAGGTTMKAGAAAARCCRRVEKRSRVLPCGRFVSSSG